jgi:alginate O-acetyltransferase complex protein AlgF
MRIRIYSGQLNKIETMMKPTSRLPRRVLATTYPAVALALMLGLASIEAHAGADDVASLYGPQPPADATYLRVVNLSTHAAKLALPGGVQPIELAPGAASRLDVVRPGTALKVRVDGGLPGGSAGTPPVAGADTVGETVTVAIERDAAGAWRAIPIAAPAASADALRAGLRVFNFVDGCDGKIALERSPASAVFTGVAAGHAASRSINPVAASLVAVCGQAVSPPFALPRLAAGQSFSLFLSGSAAHPVLSGALDALNWPAR